MTDRYKGFLVTLDKNIRSDDAEHIINALKMIKGVENVKPYVSGAEDLMEQGRERRKTLEAINEKIRELY